jgi:hypothetical protein
MATVRDEIEELRGNPVFKAFADQAMAESSESWMQESKEGRGFFKVVAEAVVAVGGDAS